MGILFIGLIVLMLEVFLLIHLTTKFDMKSVDPKLLMFYELILSISLPVITYFIFMSNFDSVAFIKGIGAMLIAYLTIHINVGLSMFMNYIFTKVHSFIGRVIIAFIFLLTSITFQIIFSAITESDSSFV